MPNIWSPGPVPSFSGSLMPQLPEALPGKLVRGGGGGGGGVRHLVPSFLLVNIHTNIQ